MASVTQRIAQIRQPRGGYIKPSALETIEIIDQACLNPDENIHCTVVGLTVDYLTRAYMANNAREAFNISLLGAAYAERCGKKKSISVAEKLLKGINGLDTQSIINACKLVTFDVWLRNPQGAMKAKGYRQTNPDLKTIENIHTFVKRSLRFFEQYGPVVQYGSTFEAVNTNKEEIFKFLCKKGNYGGYTPTVSSGDSDFLTFDTLWDFKVSKNKPTSKHTLQLLMYYIMGLHSGQTAYKGVKKLGVFNPRLNHVYLLDISKISPETIKRVEDEVICY